MIWHIFKKDWRLLWRYAALLAALEFTYVLLLFRHHPFGTAHLAGNGPLGALFAVLNIAIILAGVFLIASVSHQDAIPGVRQDWLTRPISRKHLLGAKLLFVILIVHVPMLGADALYGVSNGFPLGQSLLAASTRNIFMLLAVSFPLLALASVTGSLMEILVAVLGLVLTGALAAFLGNAFHWQLLMVYDVTAGTGLHWVPQTTAYIAGFACAAVLLGIQYFHRRTFAARALVAAGWAMFWVVTFFFPWNTAFAVERVLASESSSGNNLTLSFDATAGRLRRPPNPLREQDRALYIPLQIAGLPEGAILRADFSDVKSIDQSGTVKSFSRDQNLDFHENGAAYLKLGMEPLHALAMDQPQYDPPLRDQPFQLEIDLSLTLLRAAGETEMIGLFGPVFGDRPWRSCGNWRSEMGSNRYPDGDPAEGRISVICGPVLVQPPCVTLVLKNLPAPYVLRPSLTCYRDYGPYVARLLPGGETVRADAYLRHPPGVLHYPEGLENISQTQAFLRWYKPVEHFTRKLVIPNVGLTDWLSE